MKVTKPKTISTYLMLSYCFFSALGLTEEEFEAFKGEDPTRYCNNKPRLKTWCNSIGGKTGTITPGEPFLEGYPLCKQSTINVAKEGGCKGVTKSLTIVYCAWKFHYYYALGKGEADGHVMNYHCFKDGSCVPINDVPYS